MVCCRQLNSDLQGGVRFPTGGEGSAEEIGKSGQLDILIQILCSKLQEYFVYFKVLISKSWSKRSAVCRRRFIQRFRKSASAQAPNR